MSEPLTLYLGDELTITGSVANFNNAVVSVKTPESAQNVANKSYVDNTKTEINNLITEEINTRIQQDASTASTINILQSDITNISTQLNNLYQYFLNQNRDGPVPSRG
jgi:hypothetical protein